MAGLLLKDGQMPLTSGKPSSMFTSHENTSDDVARVLEVLLAIMEIARGVTGFAADQSGEVRLGAAFS
jgi:hypothetical protein